MIYLHYQGLEILAVSLVPYFPSLDFTNSAIIPVEGSIREQTWGNYLREGCQGKSARDSGKRLPLSSTV